MNAKQQFALALRIIGILGLIYIMRTVVRNPSLAVGLMAVRLGFALLGVYLIRGGGLVVKFAYPTPPPEEAGASAA